MGSGSGGGGQAAKQLEQERQARVDLGLAEIRRIFHGGVKGQGLASAYKPGGTYYTAGGLEVTPINLAQQYNSWLAGRAPQPTTSQVTRPTLGGSKPYTDAAQAPVGVANNWDAFLTDMANRGQLYTSKTAPTGGFNDEFYKKAGDNYLQFQGIDPITGTPIAQGRYQSQLNNAAKQMNSSLAGRGLMHSSAHDSALAGFGTAANQARQQIAGGALDTQNQLRESVLNKEQNLVNQLYATGDPTLAAQQAATTASSISLPSTFTPLTGLFNDWASMYLANRAANVYGNMPGGYQTPNYQRNNLSMMPVSSTVRK